MRNHELPNVAHHFAHVYDPANGGAPDLLLFSFAIDVYKEAGMQRNLNRGLSYLDHFVSPDVPASHIPSGSSDTLSGPSLELQMGDFCLCRSSVCVNHHDIIPPFP